MIQYLLRVKIHIKRLHLNHDGGNKLYNTIINPIASLLGKVMDVLFTGLNAIGIGNIAIAIILFTLIVKLCMLPLTIKQSKMTKLNSVIQPEIKAIQAKYKGKKGDPAAAAKMQEETKAVYDTVSNSDGTLPSVPESTYLYNSFKAAIYRDT